MFIVLIRTIILYSLVILVMRLMGKRQIGELQPYEFVITIMISDLAALPMQDTRLPLILGIIPIITLLFIKTILTQLQLKSQTARKILEGEPVILVHKGKINMKALSKQQINLDELMEELRLAGYFDLNEIQYAILENTILHKIVGVNKLYVNSYHHQAIKDLAPGLIANAISEDGLIEAVSMPNKKFVMAVQWHPEFLWKDSDENNLIIDEFIKSI